MTDSKGVVSVAQSIDARKTWSTPTVIVGELSKAEVSNTSGSDVTTFLIGEQIGS